MAITITAPTTASFAGTATSDDFLLGTAEEDTLSGGVSPIVYVTDGADTMEGGLGDDWYVVNNATDVIIEYAGEGTDAVATSVNYTLGNNLEWVVAMGTAGITITGNATDNILDGSQNAFADNLAGGGGNDTYILGATDIITAETSGVDTVQATFAVDLSVTTASTNFAASVTKAIENVTLTGSSNANITGNDANNRLTGNTGNNTISGGKGNDILDSGTAGTDSLDGGAGSDTFIIRNATTTASDSGTSTSEVDKVFTFATYTAGTGIENITLLGSSAVAIEGNSGNNMLIGNIANNTLTGGDGNDTLNGGGGNDNLSGGNGNDTYIAGVGDTISDLAGTDTAQVSGAGSITVGNVETITVTGSDNTNVNAGTATVAVKITGNDGNNSLTGGTGNDSIVGGDGGEDKDGDNVLDAGEDTDGDLVLDTDGNDTLVGGAGNDTLVGGDGTNSLVGGAGNDVYIVKSSTDTLVEASSAGTDSVQFSGSSGATLSNIDSDIETVVLLGSTNISAAYSATGNQNNTMTGNTGNNSLNGQNGNDSLNGAAGNDTLIGGAGIDTLNGGTGNDAMDGGAGNDYYYVDSLSDTVTDASGTDTVEFNPTTSNLTYTLGVDIEKLTIAGSLATNGVGNDSNNTISGNSGNNSISGGIGDDTISAGSGNDTIIGGAGADVVTAGAGNDRIQFDIVDSVSTTEGTQAAATDSIDGIDLYKDLTLNDLAGDRLDLSVTVARVGTAVSGVINEADFETDMNALLTAAGKGFLTNAGTIEAVVVTGTSGDLRNQKFLVIDVDGNDLFEVATDFVVEITGSTVTNLTTDTFL